MPNPHPPPFCGGGNKKMKKIFPQCNYLDEDGKRCRARSAITSDLHLENELYEYPRWVRVNLCPEHFLHYGGQFIGGKKTKTNQSSP